MGIPGAANPLLLRRAAAGATEVEPHLIERSLRFNHGDTPHLDCQFGDGNRRRWTVSFWAKRGRLGLGNNNAEYVIFSTSCTNTSCNAIFQFYNDDSFNVFVGYIGSKVLRTKRKFRDTASWYHFVVSFDAGNEVEKERMKMFVNGEEETEFDADNRDGMTDVDWGIGMAQNHRIGNNGNNNRSFDGYLADFYFIDSYQLSPAAFGEFDSTGVWNPKKFKLPTPNKGTTHSNGWSGTFTSGLEATKSFDGDLTTGSKPSNTNTITWTGNIEVNQGVRIYFECDDHSSAKYADIYVNGIPITPTAYNSHWDSANVVNWGANNLTEIKTTQANNKATTIKAIEVDGLILVDGRTDPSTRNNLNADSTTWSDGVTISGGAFDSGFEKTKAFDGDLTTYARNAQASATLTFTPSSGIAYSQGIRIYTDRAHTTCLLNGSSVTAPSAAGWHRIASGSGTLTSIALSKNADSSTLGVVEVDGQKLIDGKVDNSLFLNFSDTSLTRYVGKDTLNGQIASATGGKPIYVTSDTYGDVKGSGYNSEASNTIRDALVLAIPGDSVASGTCDVHQQINTGSSNKTVTVNGSVTVKTDDSRLYGSSLYFAGDEDDLQFADHDDFNVGTGDYTIEFWAKPTNNSAWQSIVAWPGSWDSTAQRIAFSDSGKFVIGNTTTGNAYGTTTCWDGNWRHFAVVRDGTTFKGYVDGVEEISFTTSASYDYSGLVIGRYPPDTYPSNYEYKGYLNDFRFYKGLAKYTANFKPPIRNDFALNNIDTVEAAAGTATFTGTLSSLKYRLTRTGANSAPELYAVEVDGTVLTSSSGLTLSQSGSGGTWSNAFDGNTGTRMWPNAAADQWIKIVWDTPITISSQIRIYAYGPNSSGIKTYLTVNSGTEYEFEVGQGTATWYTVKSPDALSNDSLTDTPTNYLPEGGTDGTGGVTRGNYPTWSHWHRQESPTGSQYHINLYEGDLKCTLRNRVCAITQSIPAEGGKFYFEYSLIGSGSDYWVAGICPADSDFNSLSYPMAVCNLSGGVHYNKNGDKNIAGTNSVDWGDDYTYGDIIGVAMDFSGTTGKVWFSKNGTWQASGNPATGANPAADSLAGDYIVACNDGGGNATSGIINFGQRAFNTAAPTGFSCLCAQNTPDLFGASDNADEDKNDPSKYFDTKIWTGSGVARTIPLNFKPDIVWVKPRTDNAGGQECYDAVRGATKIMYPHGDDVEETKSQGVTSFSNQGITLGDGTGVGGNSSGNSIVGWAWDVGTAAVTPLTGGSITPSAQWINTTAGISMCTWTGTAAGATIAHGLGKTPTWYIVKKRNEGGGWINYHVGYGASKGLNWSTTNGTISTSGYFNGTAPTDTLFSVGVNGETNGSSGKLYLAYVFAPISGYSSFGEYTGSSEDKFIHLGFQPKWLMIKVHTESNSQFGWRIIDTERDPENDNDITQKLTADDPCGENTSPISTSEGKIDLHSNGFLIRDNHSVFNTSSRSYIYAAFAEFPFKTARAR